MSDLSDAPTASCRDRAYPFTGLSELSVCDPSADVIFSAPLWMMPCSTRSFGIAMSSRVLDTSHPHSTTIGKEDMQRSVNTSSSTPIG